MRRRWISAGLAGALAVANAASCWAQRGGDAASSCAACGGCGGLFIFLIAMVALNIAILVWVARDAKARGLDNSILWMLMVLFLGLIGLVIYILARPQGLLVPCPHCGNKRLQTSVKCPHCGIGS